MWELKFHFGNEIIEIYDIEVRYRKFCLVIEKVKELRKVLNTHLHSLRNAKLEIYDIKTESGTENSVLVAKKVEC